jgi:hypothetical protein
MATVQPVQPAETTLSSTVLAPAVRASALAAWQLVEDARYRPERRPRWERRRQLAQRAVADRKAARGTEQELSAG